MMTLRRGTCAPDLEVLFGRLHLDVRVLEAELHQVVVGRVLDDEYGAAASTPPGAFASIVSSVICRSSALLS